MQYTLNTTNYRDFDVYEQNREPARAYAVPYASAQTLRQTAFRDERTHSDLVRVLRGEWDFKYYGALSDMPAVLDTDKTAFDRVTVPSTWQRTGYESPVYLNCPYPFDNVPPELPEDMSCGVYRTFFDVQDTEKVYLIDFLGAAACIDVYCNGAFVGYGEGAHNTSEFALNEYIREGQNELVVVVHKWSTGTYLECQDMFRENGIFRDVLLYALPQNYIADYEVRTQKTDAGYDLSVSMRIVGGGTVDVVLEKDGDEIARTSVAAGETATLRDLDVIEWNAEVPTVYELYLTLRDETGEVMTVRSYTGFRTIEICGNVFTFNGQKIKIKGVNHHDTHPTRGYALAFADLLRDVQLMKSLNVNAVRTSHYPPDPQFLTLCDLHGLYVVDEADIETHGCGLEPHHDMDLLSHDLRWAPRYLDRVRRMYMRDRSHPSIVMWSLGNEAGGYRCQDKCYAFLHEVCPGIPVHYEGAVRTDRFAYDVVSEMYTHDEDMRAVRDRTRGEAYTKKPFFLCEYCHAMGVGPGALEEYWDIFYSDDIFMGGCIWEWADHAVLRDGKYTYGGDHGEKRHDGNFCVDGLMYPDRTPHTGAKEMQAVYRPVRAGRVRGNTFVFENTNRFRSSGYLTVEYSLLKDGKAIAGGVVPLDIPPTQREKVTLDLPKVSGDCFINFIYTDAGRPVATEQIALRQQMPAQKAEHGSVALEETDDEAVFRFEGGEAAFCKTTGALRRYIADGMPLLHPSPVGGVPGFVPNLYRARLDNDVHAEGMWRWEARLHHLQTVFQNFTCSVRDGKGCAAASYSLEGGGRRLFALCLSYTVLGQGTIEVQADLSPVCDMDVVRDLPRFGLSVELPDDMRSVTYYGRGPLENLPDMQAQSTVGLYSATVGEMQEPYIKPQDNGNHGETRFVELRNHLGAGLRVTAADKAFSFNVRPFTQTLLCGAKHREDLHDEHTTVLEIDGFVRGTGTASCGQDTLPQYRVNAENGLSFAFRVTPLAASADAPENDLTAQLGVHDTIRLPRAESPEAVGIPSEAVRSFVEAVEAEGFRYHSMFILRGGKVAAEVHRYPFSPDIPHIMYSISKSVTACAVGLAIAEGYLSLDTTIAEVFPEIVPENDAEEFSRISVRYLLNMTSGKMPSYMSNKTKGEWMRQFAESKWYAKPGREFKYVNENPYMLCAMLRRRTGMTVSEFLTPRLWEPLGIRTPFWETDETGTESGGWGLFLTPESFAKFTLMIQNHGVFGGKQIVPRAFLDEATSVQTPFGPENTERIGYGYCFWIATPDEFQSSGVFGQVGYCFKDEDLAVVTVAGDMQNDFIYPLIRKLKAAVQPHALPETDETQATREYLASRVLDVLPQATLRSSIEQTIQDKILWVNKTLSSNLIGFPPSVLPLPAVYMTKDRAGNMDRFQFRFFEKYALFQWREGDETCCVRLGLDGHYRVSRITLAGTRYMIYGAAYWTDETTLQVWVRPIESIGIRYLTFRFNGKKVTVSTASEPTLEEVLGDVRFTIDEMFHTRLGKNVGGKLFDSIQRIAEPLLHGEILERAVKEKEDTAEDTAIHAPDDGIADTVSV